MNRIIKQQLEKVRAQISDYTDDTTIIYISKQFNPEEAEIVIGKTYQIELADYILNESDNFTLSVNWNKGIIPKDKYLIALVTNIIGNMIQANCVGFNKDLNMVTNNNYVGLWLPKKFITILGEYK